MSRQEWSQVRGLLERALQLDAPAREALFDHACAGNAPLRMELRELLALDNQADALEPPERDRVQVALDRLAQANPESAP